MITLTRIEEESQRIENEKKRKNEERKYSIFGKKEKRETFSLLKEVVLSGSFMLKTFEHYKYSQMIGKVICVDGIIGAGKTTLGRKLETYLQSIGIKAKFYTEFVDNTFLELYYSKIKDYAFAFQLFMLRSCIASFDIARYFSVLDGTVSIIDRSVVGNSIFAELHHSDYKNINDEEWEVYTSVLSSQHIHHSDYLIYLKCSTETALRRIQGRGRDSERNMEKDYLTKLNEMYENKMIESKMNENENVIVMDWDQDMNTQTIQNLLDTILSSTQTSTNNNSQ